MNRYFKNIILIILLISVLPSFSQRKKVFNLPRYDFVKLHFGMALGMNSMQATVYHSDAFPTLDSVYALNVNPQMGFNINIVTNYNINKYASIRFLPGLNFGQRNLEYTLYNGKKYSTKLMEIESTYLDFPLLFQFKSDRLNNFRMYLIGGFNYKLDLSSQKKIPDEEKPKIRFKRHTFCYETGVGFDFFLPYFKFAIEAKASFGINNVLIPDQSQYSTSVNALKPKMITISFLFEGSDVKFLNFFKWFKKK